MTIEPLLQDLPAEDFDQGRSGDLLRRYKDLYGPEIPVNEYNELVEYADAESAYFDVLTDEELQADTEDFLAHLPDNRIEMLDMNMTLPLTMTMSIQVDC